MYCITSTNTATTVISNNAMGSGACCGQHKSCALAITLLFLLLLLLRHTIAKTYYCEASLIMLCMHRTTDMTVMTVAITRRKHVFYCIFTSSGIFYDYQSLGVRSWRDISSTILRAHLLRTRSSDFMSLEVSDKATSVLLSVLLRPHGRPSSGPVATVYLIRLQLWQQRLQ